MDDPIIELSPCAAAETWIDWLVGEHPHRFYHGLFPMKIMGKCSVSMLTNQSIDEVHETSKIRRFGSDMTEIR